MKWMTLFAFALLLAFSTSSFAQDSAASFALRSDETSAHSSSTTDENESRFLPAFGGAILGNATAFAIGSLVAAAACSKPDEEWGCLGPLALGGITYGALELPLTALGASSFGAGFDGEMRYGWTLLGASIGLALGSAVGYGAYELIDSDDSMANVIALFTIAGLSSSLGAALAYEWSRDDEEFSGVAIAPTASLSQDGGSIGLVGIF